jgi:hypothetical protein
VAGAAALLQFGVSNGSTINNQLKALAAMATETATMIATMTMIKAKATLAAWRQCSRQHGGITAVPAALRQHSESTRGGGGGGTLE